MPLLTTFWSREMVSLVVGLTRQKPAHLLNCLISGLCRLLVQMAGQAYFYTKLRRVAAHATQREASTLPGGERDNIHRRLQDRETIGHPALVIVGEMSVSLAHQDSAVGMPQPVRDGHKVDVLHDAL